MSKQQRWPAPDSSPLSQINRLLLIVHQPSDLLGLVVEGDKFVTVWLVSELPNKASFPDGTREILSVLAIDQIPTWLAKAVRSSNGQFIFNKYQTTPFEITALIERAAKRLQRAVPVVFVTATDTDTVPASDLLETFVRANYDFLAANPLSEVQRVAILARQKVDSGVNQQTVQPICEIIDAEQGCRQAEGLRSAIQAVLEPGYRSALSAF